MFGASGGGEIDMTQTIIVAIVVLAAVVWAIWSIIRRTGSGGCASCGSAGTCPYASRGACPSDAPANLQVCDEIVENQQPADEDAASRG
jgi:hypothetical protein